MAIADLQKELPNLEYPIGDQAQADTYKAMNELAGAYYKAKWDHHIDKTLSRLQITNTEYDREWAQEHDKDMKQRVELMYSYDDISNDRNVLRRKFISEMNKKTTLKDIGAKLDEFILDSKADAAQFYQLDRTPFEYPNAATRDQTTPDFDWKENIMQSFDSVKPHFIEDEQQLEDDNIREKYRKKEIIAEVEWNDSTRQHNLESLTQDEKTEISLFHSLKQDPFYKHHLRNYLSNFIEQQNNNVINFNSGKGELNPNDYAKFDRINLFDFRRMLPKKERSD